jgi:non-canonical poly(A) RNA polymerase PAPD5/7
MKPPRTRLTCHAHNRFSPSIALWQHFVSPHGPCLVHQRLSSSASEAAQDTPSKHNGLVNPQEASGLAPMEAEAAQEEGGQLKQPRLAIRKSLTSKGTWYPSKVDASVAKNFQIQRAARRTDTTASEQLVAVPRAAFQAAEDYTGVVVQPMTHPNSPKVGGPLPWSVPQEERNMAGIDRYDMATAGSHTQSTDIGG